MRRKLFCAIGAAGALVGASLFSLAVPAVAQYPPAACPSDTSSFAGEFSVGQTLTVPLTNPCFVGQNVAKSVNGTGVGTENAGADGSVAVAVTAVSTSQFSVDDPVATGAQCGRNHATGVAANGSTHTATFHLLCPGVAAQPGRAVGAGRVALTGANVARWGAIAVGLIVIGGVFIAADRRKARTRG